MSESALLEVRGLAKTFPVDAHRRGAVVRAVDGVDLDLREGELLGLVGESGCGKSTLGQLVVRLLEPDRGSVRFDRDDLGAMPPSRLRARRRDFQIVFQDPQGALNPRMTVGRLVAEPLVVHRIGTSRADRDRIVARLLREVGLDEGAARRYPHELSGGQRQRVGIARAIACEPRLLVADEPFSALDPPVQAQIVNLLLDLRERRGLAILLIAHDLRLIEHVCDRVAVMYLGRIVEEASAATLYRDPQHPYTRALLASTPQAIPGRPTPPALAGEPPSGAAIPPGCRFRPRCPIAEIRCAREDPVVRNLTPEHRVACHLIAAPDEPGGVEDSGAGETNSCPSA